MTNFKIDPVASGREDCDDAIANGADAAAMAKPGQLGADEALINAMNRSWVLEAAGVDIRVDTVDLDEAWERVGLPWCAAYNEAFRLRGQHQDTGAGSEGRDGVAGQDLPAVSTGSSHTLGVWSAGGFWLLSPVAFLRRAAAWASDWIFGPPGPHDWRI